MTVVATTFIGEWILLPALITFCNVHLMVRMCTKACDLFAMGHFKLSSAAWKSTSTCIQPARKCGWQCCGRSLGNISSAKADCLVAHGAYHVFLRVPIGTEPEQMDMDSNEGSSNMSDLPLSMLLFSAFCMVGLLSNTRGPLSSDCIMCPMGHAHVACLVIFPCQIVRYTALPHLKISRLKSTISFQGAACASRSPLSGTMYEMLQIAFSHIILDKLNWTR
jgi:hypothetical protein